MLAVYMIIHMMIINKINYKLLDFKQYWKKASRSSFHPQPNLSIHFLIVMSCEEIEIEQILRKLGYLTFGINNFFFKLFY